MDASKKARKRMEIILQVQSGALKVTEAAKALGIARQNYYEWENRALEAMLSALTDKEAGRPTIQKDPEKEELQKEVKDLRYKLEISEKSRSLQKLLADLDLPSKLPSPDSSAGKKKLKPGKR